MNITEIPQQDLIDNIENRSFIKCYYQHDIARFGDRFWFDKGLDN